MTQMITNLFKKLSVTPHKFLITSIQLNQFECLPYQEYNENLLSKEIKMNKIINEYKTALALN